MYVSLPRHGYTVNAIGQAVFPHRHEALSEIVIGGFLVVLFLCDLVQEKSGKGKFFLTRKL